MFVSHSALSGVRTGDKLNIGSGFFWKFEGVVTVYLMVGDLTMIVRQGATGPSIPRHQHQDLTVVPQVFHAGGCPRRSEEAFLGR